MIEVYKFSPLQRKFQDAHLDCDSGTVVTNMSGFLFLHICTHCFVFIIPRGVQEKKPLLKHTQTKFLPRYWRESHFKAKCIFKSLLYRFAIIIGKSSLCEITIGVLAGKADHKKAVAK